MRSLWEHRQVLRMLVLRDLQREYTKFRLGYVWTLLEPLGMAVILYLVFSTVLGRGKLGEQPYLLFLCVAILPWWWFTKGISASTRMFRRNGAQLRISMLPTHLWVMRVMLVALAEFILSLPVIFIAMAVTRTLPGPLIVLYPIGMLMQFLLMYGLATIISSITVSVPDAGRIVRILMRVLFYLTPVLYSIANIPKNIQPWAGLNPLVGPIGLYRVGFWQGEHETPITYTLSLSLCLVVFVVGLLVFRRREHVILKEAGRG